MADCKNPVNACSFYYLLTQELTPSLREPTPSDVFPCFLHQLTQELTPSLRGSYASSIFQNMCHFLSLRGSLRQAYANLRPLMFSHKLTRELTPSLRGSYAGSILQKRLLTSALSLRESLRGAYADPTPIDFLLIGSSEYYERHFKPVEGGF